MALYDVLLAFANLYLELVMNGTEVFWTVFMR